MAGQPALRRRHVGREMAKFVHAFPLGEHTDHSRRGRLDDLEIQRAGDVPGHRHHHHDDAAAAEVTMMERETLGYGIGRPHVSRRLLRSEEHTSELQSLMRISYAVFCLNKKNTHTTKP